MNTSFNLRIIYLIDVYFISKIMTEYYKIIIVIILTFDLIASPKFSLKTVCLIYRSQSVLGELDGLLKDPPDISFWR